MKNRTNGRCMLVIVLLLMLLLTSIQSVIAQEGPGEPPSDPAGQPSPQSPVDLLDDNGFSEEPGLIVDSHPAIFHQGPAPEVLAAQIDLAMTKAPFVIDYVPENETQEGSYIPCVTVPDKVKSAANRAVSTWASVLNAPYPVPIHIKVCWQMSNLNASLAYGGPAAYAWNFPNAPLRNKLYPTALANILTGHDVDGDSSMPEILVSINSRPDYFGEYYYGTGTTPAGQYNMTSFFLHAIGQGLGFSSSLWVWEILGEISGGWGVNVSDDASQPLILQMANDRFILDHQGRPLTNTDVYPNGSDILGGVIANGPIYFSGPNAKGPNNGWAVKLKSPTPGEIPETVKYLDDSFNGTPDALMTTITKGETIYSPGRIVTGIFADMGWTIASTQWSAPRNILINQNTIIEGLPVGAVVGVLAAADPNVGDTFTYALVPGTGSTDNAKFTVNGSLLKTNAILNYEVKRTLSIRLQVTDQTGESFEKALIITVADVNEAPTDIFLPRTSLPESDQSQAVGPLITNDPDTYDELTYSLVPGAGSTDNGNFSIQHGGILVIRQSDYEIKNSYSVRVRATDQGGLYTEKVFTITITNVNESPITIYLSNSITYERRPVGTTIGTLSSLDEDLNDPHTYSLDCPAPHNSLVGLSGNTLVTAVDIDYEVNSVLEICVRATDQGGLTMYKPFKITVKNVNEMATRIELYPTWILPESKAGCRVGILLSDDPDINDPLIYTLTQGFDDNNLFTIDGSQLILVSDLTKGEGETFSIQVELKDSFGAGPAPQAFSLTVLVPTNTYLPALGK